MLHYSLVHIKAVKLLALWLIPALTLFPTLFQTMVLWSHKYHRGTRIQFNYMQDRQEMKLHKHCKHVLNYELIEDFIQKIKAVFGVKPISTNRIAFVQLESLAIVITRLWIPWCMSYLNYPRLIHAANLHFYLIRLIYQKSWPKAPNWHQ